MLSLILALALSAHADDACQAKALARDLQEAAPVAAAGLFVKLADCDAAAARRVAPDVVPTFLSGEDGNAAVVKAIQVGASGPVIKWVDALRSDERASAIAALGATCNDSPEVQQFFLSRAKNLGDDFFTQRWYRAISECHVSSLQDVLWKRLSGGLGKDRTGFFGVLEAYSRSAQAAAVPKLKQLALEIKDEEAQTYIVAAFADAAQVGSLDGMNQKTAHLAIAALLEIAPKLQVKAVEQARITIDSLGDERAADELVAVRYNDLKQSDGQLLWGALVVESATCKNGKDKQRFHYAKVLDPGQTWPDQLKGKVTAGIESVWTLNLAQSCKGEGTVTYLVPNAPFADKGAWKAWADEQMIMAQKDSVAKPQKVEEEPVQL